jgi:hypothetical protein
MSRMTVAALACALPLLAAPIVSAQSKTIEGERTTVKATVEAIEQSTRMVTLRDPKGELHTVRAPETMKRFSEMKVGDTITATYYENMTLRMKQPGEPDVDTLHDKVTPGSGARPGATSATQRSITATISAIDPAVPSITFKGPSNWIYSTKVHDKKALSQVKVGDKVDIIWTEALLVGMEPPSAAPKK